MLFTDGVYVFALYCMLAYALHFYLQLF